MLVNDLSFSVKDVHVSPSPGLPPRPLRLGPTGHLHSAETVEIERVGIHKIQISGQVLPSPLGCFLQPPRVGFVCVVLKVRPDGDERHAILVLFIELPVCLVRGRRPLDPVSSLGRDGTQEYNLAHVRPDVDLLAGFVGVLKLQLELRLDGILKREFLGLPRVLLRQTPRAKEACDQLQPQ